MDGCAGPFATAAPAPGGRSTCNPSSSSAASSNTCCLAAFIGCAACSQTRRSLPPLSKPPGRLRPRAQKPARRQFPSPTLPKPSPPGVVPAGDPPWSSAASGARDKTGPRGCPTPPWACRAPPDRLETMTPPCSFAVLFEDQPPPTRSVQIGFASLCQPGSSRFADPGGCGRPDPTSPHTASGDSSRSAQPPPRGSDEGESKTFCISRQGGPNEPWAAASFNPVM